METEGAESKYIPYSYPYSYPLVILGPGKATDQGVNLLEKEVRTYLEYGRQEKDEFEGLETFGGEERLIRIHTCNITKSQEVVVKIDVRKLLVLFCFYH